MQGFGIKTTRRSMILTGVALAALTTTAELAVAQDAVKGVISFEIEAQPLGTALTEYARQSEERILFSPKLVEGKMAPALYGEYEPINALSSLLTGADINFSISSSDTIKLTEASKIMKPKSRSETVDSFPETTSSSTRVAQVPAQSSESKESNVQGLRALTPSEDLDEDDEKDEIVAVGTRIRGANVTQRVLTISAEDLRLSGVTSVEDALRRVQLNFSSTNSDADVLANSREGLQLGAVPDGISGINLRGLGTENTLVLVNGRRVAGAAGNFNGFANIANIPLSAIERIELLPDGASAAYGSDAVGGAVNIVLRKDYDGAELSARYEFSSTDADGFKLSGTYGTGWGSGRFSSTVSYSEQDQINAFKAGYTTRLYPGLARDDAGNVVDVDFTRTQSLNGRIEQRSFVFFPSFMVVTNFLTLPPGSNGVGAAVGDFVNQDTVATVLDRELIPEFLGTDRKQYGATFNLTQDITQDLEFFADVLWSQSHTFRTLAPSDARVFLGADNPFNPFGTRQTVRYLPLQELNDGILDPREFETEQTQINVSSGFNWDINDQFDFGLTGTYSRSESDNSQRNLLDTNSAVLTTSDPSTAVNLIGDGTTQNAAAIQALYSRSERQRPITELWSIEPILRGEVLDIWGGPIKFAVGGEYREEQLKRSALLQANANSQTNKTEIKGLFVEADLPFVSSQNARSGVQSLSVSLQGRYDEYSTSGLVGADTASVSFDNFSPRIGVAYSPVEGLNLRGSWGESFRAPTAGEFFGSAFPFTTNFDDPLAPGGPAIIPGLATLFGGSNADLEPETSKSLSLGAVFRPEFAENLTLTFDYSRVNFKNRITNTAVLQSSLPADVFASLPGVVERDAMGNAVQLNLINLNLDRRFVESIDASAEYVFDTTKSGEFTVGLEGLYYLDLFDEISSDFDRIETLGTSRGPVEYKLTGHLGWALGNGGADLFIYHTPSNINTQSVVRDGAFLNLSTDVGSYTTADISAYYNVDKYGVRMSGGIRNVLDEEFPLSPSAIYSYDPARVDPRGRVLFVELTKTF